MKLKYCLLAVLWPVMNGYAQPSAVPRLLRIGDTLPIFPVMHIYNDPASLVSHAFLANKYLILDFWATWCGSCVESFPETQLVQEKWKKKLQVLLVNTDKRDTEEKVEIFFKKRAEKTGLIFSLPYVLQDSILVKWFPHSFIPHLVWLDPKGIVIAITEKTALTENNLRLFTEGKSLMEPPKYDEQVYKYKNSLWSQMESDTAIRFYSVLTKEQPTLRCLGGTVKLPSSKATKIFTINFTLLSLLYRAYRDLSLLPASSISWQISPADLQTIYCYEAILPTTDYDMATRLMQADLTRYLGVEVLLKKTNGKVTSAIVHSKLHNH